MYSGRRISPRKMVKNKTDLKYSPHRNRSVRRSLTRSKTSSSSASSSSSSTPKANVKVVVRVRPPNQKENGNNSRTVIKVVENNVVIFDPKEDDEPFFYHGVQQRGRDLLKKANKNIKFIFDRVFGYDSDNVGVFHESTKNLIQSLMNGYNCSVFVYGATGAGKTHTMLGHNDNPGITFLTMQELFNQIEILREERDFELGITYLEVYNETVKDLLNPGPPLHLREDRKFGVCVAGIILHRIKNPDELFALLKKGNGNRTQHATDANAESSRSHAVFQVYVNMNNRHTNERRIAKLSMIDLAGSERGAATGCSGMRFTEGANINKSLLALGNCINSLADGRQHIPYRDSKLTRLLKDSLGGNCQTVMIANISPSSLNYEDTYNTLKYATRAKKIKSNMKKNVVNRELSVPQYIKLIGELNRTIDSLKAQLQSQNVAVVTTTSSSCSCNSDELQEKPERSDKDPTWVPQLQALLKEKHALQKQILTLTNSEVVLDCRIKFKEGPNTLMSNFCLDNEQLESGRNRMINKVSSYERQKNTIMSQLVELKSQHDTLENKFQSFIEEENISEADNSDILRYHLEFKTTQYELHMQHMNKIVEIYQNELDNTNKLNNRMSEALKQYYQLLQGHGHMTDDMAATYRSMFRSAQGIRSVTFENEENSFAATEQHACNSEVKQTTNDFKQNLARQPKEYSNKRAAIKRKLYETESDTAIQFKKELLDDDNNSVEINLNETVVLPQSSINGDAINNTFCLHDKEPTVPNKKTALTDRSNMVSAVDILPRVYKETSAKQTTEIGRENNRANLKAFNAMSRTQRFPLRSKDPEAARKSARDLKAAAIRSNITHSKK